MKLRIALPKGRLWESTVELLAKSGIDIDDELRNYRPASSQADLEFFIVKPRNIPKMVESGMVDLGIVGTDMVMDECAKVSLMLDLKTMPVYLVVAGKKPVLNSAQKHKQQKLKVATEYENIAKDYFSRLGKEIEILKTYGSTECFVPDFADLIVDHTQTGTTLKKNKLHVFGVILKSTTHLIANPCLSSKKKIKADIVKDMLSSGMKMMDLTYPDFLNIEQIKENKF